MERVLIIGAGGHAQVAADIVLRMRDAGVDVTPVGYLDDNPRLTGARLLGLPVFGPLAALSAVEHDALLIAIGDNRTRRALYQQLLEVGEHFFIARHPSAIIAPDARIEPGTLIAARAIVNPGVIVGANVILNSGCIVEHHNRIGAHAHIAPGVTLGGEVVVGEGALVGIGATVLPRCVIGEWSVIGGGALATGAIADKVLAVGVPARITRYL